MVPNTGQQLLIVVLCVLPGVVYQAARSLFRAPSGEDADTTSRLLRALAAGLLLDAVYLVAFGPQALRLVTSDKHTVSWRALQDHARPVGAVVLVLFVIIPAALAVAEYLLTRRQHRARYDATPTAWDQLFRHRHSCFVRAKLKQGGWVGGWYGAHSAASAYPHAGDLYVQAQYHMAADGTFGDRIPDTGGFYLRTTDIDVLEILEIPSSK